jgi:acyl-CoA thioester hydrolase
MSDKAALITARGVIQPSDCDLMQHLNTASYVRIFDTATWGLLFELGYRPRAWATRGHGWADVRQEISYQHELRVGDLYIVESGVERLGRTSVSSVHVLKNVELAIECARLTQVTVQIDVGARRPTPLPEGFGSPIAT